MTKQWPIRSRSNLRCPNCGARKLPEDSLCMSCASWQKRQQAGSAPEFGRGGAKSSAAKTEGDTQSNTHQQDPSDTSLADDPLSRSIFRHPAGKAKLWALGAYPCFLHHTPDRFECEGCLRNFELDHEMGQDAS